MFWIQKHILSNGRILENIFYSILIFIIFYAIKRYAIRVVRKKNYVPAKQFTTKKIVNALFNFLLFAGLLIIWWTSSSKQYIISFIGFFTAGMAIAMRDVILNMIGALYIMWATPFKMGDRIEISGQIGDVIDIRLLQFSILEVGNRVQGEQSTGRIIHIPNMQVFSVPLANYEKGFEFIWNEIEIPLDRNSDWELAKELLDKLLKEHTKEIIEEAKEQIDAASKEYLIYYNNLTPVIYTELKGEHITLTARYLCKPRQVRMSEHRIWEALLRLFKAHPDIKLG